MKYTLTLILFIALGSLSYPATVYGFLFQQQTDKKLEQVKSEISKQKSTIKQVNSKRASLEKQLREDDLAIAKVVRSLKRTQTSIDQTQRTIRKLKKQQSELERKKKQQEAILAKQLRAAYSTGHHDYIKLLLNQQNPGKVQRSITYYQYLNKARIAEIEQFQDTIKELQTVAEQQAQQAAKYQQLKEAQQRQQVALKEKQQQQKQTLAQLKTQLLNSQQQLEKLEQEEENLIAELARIAKLSQQDVELKGLAHLKRKLSWPVKGRINRSFGSKKQGYLKWKGVLMGAPVGREVKTIHNGVILFSDWLKGYGLVTVVDHGGGYMSLYGHNQALLKSVGDRVETGEPIALVGQSGGQSSSGLYFEIRHNGEAVNPKLWCR